MTEDIPEIAELKRMIKEVSDKNLAPVKKAMEHLKNIIKTTSQLNVILYNLSHNNCPWWQRPWLHIQRIILTKKLRKIAQIK